MQFTEIPLAAPNVIKMQISQISIYDIEVLSIGPNCEVRILAKLGLTKVLAMGHTRDGGLLLGGALKDGSYVHLVSNV